ncbi:MAG: cell division protein ZapA [Alphaproteobacteria bacterium]|nr:cell division protein ZapA [Alphaproteobacteria bacterium]
MSTPEKIKIQLKIGRHDIPFACYPEEEERLHALEAYFNQYLEMQRGTTERRNEAQLISLAGVMLSDRCMNLEDTLSALQADYDQQQQLLEAERKSHAATRQGIIGWIGQLQTRLEAVHSVASRVSGRVSQKNPPQSDMAMDGLLDAEGAFLDVGTLADQNPFDAIEEEQRDDNDAGRMHYGETSDDPLAEFELSANDHGDDSDDSDDTLIDPMAVPDWDRDGAGLEDHASALGALPPHAEDDVVLEDMDLPFAPSSYASDASGGESSKGAGLDDVDFSAAHSPSMVDADDNVELLEHLHAERDQPSNQ